MSIKRLKSNKLFFNKWPYKVECNIGGANKITIYGIERATAWCEGVDSLPSNWRTNYNSHINKTELLKFIRSVEPFLEKKTELKVRAEGSHFNIFCKDSSLLSKMCKELKPWLKAVHGPTTQEEYDFLVSNDNKKVLCDNLPHENFKYKIFLKQKMKSTSRETFLSWTERYDEEQIKISPTTRNWLNGDLFYKQDPFFYIKDSSMLTMARLFLSDNIRIVHEFVPRKEVIKE
jgi:hypothetical protein